MEPIQLTAEEILAIDDIPSQDVVVPEWKNATVRVVGLNGKDASDFSSKLVEVDGKGKITAIKLDGFLPELLSKTLHNLNGERIFKTEEQVKALGLKSAAVLKRLGDVASKLSGLDEQAAENAEKN